MGTKHFHTLLRADGFTVGTWACTCDDRGPTAEQHTAVPTVNVPITGLFARHVGRRPPRVVDPTVATVSLPGDTWRTSHPAGAGDTGVWVMLGEPDLDELGGRRTDAVVPLDPATWWRWRRVSEGGGALEEEVRSLLGELLGPPLPDAEPAVVRRAKAVLASRLRDPPSLAALAEEVGASRWHLCRVFRAATGAGPHAWGEQVRLRAAADAVGAGRRDLAELALELGFSSHSHLTDRFRRAFGVPPSALRTR